MDGDRYDRSGYQDSNWKFGNFSDKKVREFVKQADKDNDGKISKEEAKEIYSRTYTYRSFVETYKS
ncbi:MAG TPA: hypothetical protein DCS13_09045 [Candidatus Margulisbacteria bacterium]|nr:hypothetical protein [Candidatus Margulisiibacteriota bacterium]